MQKMSSGKIGLSQSDAKRKMSSAANSSGEVGHSPINVPRNIRKFTDNMGENMFSSNKNNEMSTTLGGTTSGKVRQFNCKESELDGYNASCSMVSTPTIVNKVIRLNRAESPIKANPLLSKLSIVKPLDNTIKENEVEESRKESTANDQLGSDSPALAIIKLDKQK